MELSINVDIKEVKELYNLNAVQSKAFVNIVQSRPVGLLQGPPGTGKTKFIAALIHFVLSRGYVRNVLLASQSHEAVNNAAEAVLKLFPAPRAVPSILRVGQEGNVSGQLLPYHVARVETLYKDRFSATVRDRLRTAAAALGISAELADQLIVLETIVRPVLDQMNALASDESAESAPRRLSGLSLTLESLLTQHQLETDVPEFPDEDFLPGLFNALAKKHECSNVTMARFRAVARLSRDICGSVLTRERSFETFLAGTRRSWREPASALVEPRLG